VVERPKVIYNDKTRKYVLWMHMDSSVRQFRAFSSFCVLADIVDQSYGEARVAVASGDSVCGKYTYHRSFQP
jgi:hypothetical protein